MELVFYFLGEYSKQANRCRFGQPGDFARVGAATGWAGDCRVTVVGGDITLALFNTRCKGSLFFSISVIVFYFVKIGISKYIFTLKIFFCCNADFKPIFLWFARKWITKISLKF